MKQLGFAMTYYPAGICSDRGLIVFEAKVYAEGQPTRFIEVLDGEFNMPTGIEMEAPEIPWMLHILGVASVMVTDAAIVGDESSTDPTFVKAALASVKKLLAD